MTRHLFFLFIALALLFYCEPLHSQQQDIVARITDKYTISFPELKRYVIDYQYTYRYSNNIPEAARKALDDMILNRMKVIDFFDRRLNEKRDLLQGIMRVLNEELAIEYFNTQFFDKYVGKEAVRNAYKQMGKEVVYRQIVLMKPKSASPQVMDSLKSLAKILRTKIESGVSFTELAREYSSDTKSTDDCDLMPPLTWKMSLFAPMYGAIFHLSVGRVDIVETSKDIRVVKVDRIDTVGVPSYEEAKDDIRRALAGKYMFVAGNEFDRMKKSLVNESSVKWNEVGMRRLLRWSNIPGFYQTVYSDTIGSVLSQGDNFPILEYDGGKVVLREYLHLINDVLTLGRGTGIGEDDFKKFILEAVRTDKIVRRARGLGLEKDILNPGTKDPDLINGIIRIYDGQVIDKQIPPATEEALKVFYQANRDSLYYQLAKVNIYAVVDSSESEIEKLKEKLDQGVHFEKLAGTVLVKTYVRKRNGTIASYFSTEPPYLGEAAFKLKLFETAGPIDYDDSATGKQYALIKCMATRGDKQLTFDDARKSIVDNFRKYYRNRIAQSVTELLRKKYAVTIYGDVLRQNLISSGINPQ